MASTSLSQRANSANSVRVHGHYYRSVNLQRDYQASPSLEHYLITPTVARLSRRIVQALATPNGNRTWSITGPYGTGKSAFALFLSKLLARELEHPEAESFIAGFDRTGLNGLFPVLIVGQRRNLKVALLESLAAHTKAQLPKLYQTIRAELDRATQGDALPSDDAVLHCYEQAHEALQMQGFAGLMVIIDEFGKFLEHTAEHNDDLLILQSLAEFASRSAAPFGLITILHTAFGHYLTDVSDERQRAEWQKVQGRFQDVAFQEPPEQLLWLVSDALKTSFEPDVVKAYNDRLSRALQSKALEEAAQRFPLDDLLPECVPLSPLTTLLLYPLFRSKLAQNERSLFAFLTSVEPFSVQAWLTGLQDRDWQRAPLYGLPELYDYISTSLGTGLYQGDSSRRWVEIADALDRLGADAPPQSSRMIKSIGLLWMYGATVGLRASEDALVLALADLKEDRAEVQEALAYLERRSIVVYRRFDQAYALWEGSDIDLGSHYQAARRSLQQGNLAERLGKLVDLRPVVARAHYITTGTLRYFRPQLIDGTEATLDAVFSHPFALGEEDGRITFVLSQDDSERERLIRYAQTLAEQQDADTTIKRHILAFPKPISGLEEHLKQLEAWRYVEANTPALSGDRVARRELQANVVHAQNRLEATAGSVLGLRGYRFDPGASDWLHAGEPVTFASAVAFQRWLSSLCDALYHAAPPLHNELLNREKHSSSAKAALNKLVKAMLNAPEQYRFGVSGTPAEVSMYEAFFRQSGAHVPLSPHADDSPGDGPWRITAPSEPQWQPLWQAVQDFLTESQHERKPVTELYQQLRQPPYGLKAGVLPLLLYLALLEKPDEIALYRDGLYQPALSDELSELLTHVPEHFAVQRFRFDDAAKATLDALHEALRTAGLDVDAETTDANALLMRLSRPLVISVFQLNDYSKKTRALTPPEAVTLRDTLLQATDPYTLLLHDVPKILGVAEPQTPDEHQRLTRELHRALNALLTAYPRLLDSIEQQVADVFGLAQTDPRERFEALQAKTQPLQDYAHTAPLSLFVREVTRLEPSKRDWREVIGRVLMDGLPPSNWRDRHALEFQVNLTQLRHEFVRLSELVHEKSVQSDTERIVRVDVLAGEHKTWRRSIPVQTHESEQVQDLARRIKHAILSSGINNTANIALAALAQALQEQIEDSSHDDS